MWLPVAVRTGWRISSATHFSDGIPMGPNGGAVDAHSTGALTLSQRIWVINGAQHSGLTGPGPITPSPGALPERVADGRKGTPGLCLRSIVWRILRREPGQLANRLLPQRVHLGAAWRPRFVAL